MSHQPNVVLIYNNINVKESFDVPLAPDLNTGIFDACLIESLMLLSSRLACC